MRTKIIQALSGAFGVAHLLVETTADIIVEAEVLTVKAVSKKGTYSADKIRKSRQDATLNTQVKAIDSYLRVKDRIINKKYLNKPVAVQPQTP
jgi:hypothetical protein